MPRNNFDDRDDSADFQMNDSAESRPLTFGELGVPGPLVRVLAADDKKTAFPIQADTLPDSLAGRDILGRGRTGSGKTLAFSIPLVTRLGSYDSFGEIAMEEFRKEIKRRKKASLEERRADDFLPHPRGLVLAPTRELANQINDVLMPLAQIYGINTTTVYGGVRYARQIRDLQAGADIVVACPGRLEDLIEQGALTLDKVEVAVIDEADEMADMGFLPPVVHIRDNMDLQPARYRILMKGVEIGSGDAYPGRWLAINPGTAAGSLPGEKTVDPAFGLDAIWIESALKEQAQIQGFTVVEASTVVATHLNHLIGQFGH